MNTFIQSLPEWFLRIILGGMLITVIFIMVSATLLLLRELWIFAQELRAIYNANKEGTA